MSKGITNMGADLSLVLDEVHSILRHYKLGHYRAQLLLYNPAPDAKPGEWITMGSGTPEAAAAILARANAPDTIQGPSGTSAELELRAAMTAPADDVTPPRARLARQQDQENVE